MVHSCLLKKIYPGGPELIEKAKQIAQRLGRSNFKVLMGGWENGKRDTILMECFGEHYQIKGLERKERGVLEAKSISKG